MGLKRPARPTLTLPPLSGPIMHASAVSNGGERDREESEEEEGDDNSRLKIGEMCLARESIPDRRDICSGIF